LRCDEGGAYAGTYGQDNVALLDDVSEDVADSAGHIGTGNAARVLSCRVWFSYGLEGAAVTVVTVCWSSLLALLLAAQALRSGECSMALVGGFTVMPNPDVYVDFSSHLGIYAECRC
ncbi:beta-ketoacyl synthase N-terminal-like domain-containing protein, partial [Streptomyces sp. BE303]|uniref:beta-ketoacyl synthase N-terminal-like domain-containing protein n=1 Tax=Streptomyces sp. BE303 TaxID=3002528 RepID=UPI002E7845B0